MHTELDALKADSATQKAALKAAQDAIAQMEERHTVATQKAVDDARRQVKAQLSAASEAGDYDGMAELTDKLTQLNTVQAEPKVAPLPAPVFTPPADLIQWNAENPWFGTNKRKTALALGIAQELRESGDMGTGREFYDRVLAEVNKPINWVQKAGKRLFRL